MSNKTLFKSGRGVVPTATTVNAAGGKAYQSQPKQALAQIAATNCFNGTFYASAEDNLKIAKDAALALKGDPEFIAKAAVYSRSKGYMKDMPAFLMAILADVDSALFRQVFPLVIDNGKMLRNFCQIARSGATGRVFNLSSQSIRKAIGSWFNTASAGTILSASIGNEFPLRDILRMSKPKPASEEKAALLAYLNNVPLEDGKFVTRWDDAKVYNAEAGPKRVLYSHDFSSLPEFIQQYENYKKTKEGTPPRVDFRLLDSLGLTNADWRAIARTAPWTMTRMNLNTFARHGVFEGSEGKALSSLIAKRLSDPVEIAKARVFPYQLMMAWKATEGNSAIPAEVREALQDAMEVACDNVPEIPGQIEICIDTSGSMSGPITGVRAGSTTKVTCLDVAAMFAASLLRKNRMAEVLPFAESLKTQYIGKVNGRDSIATNATKLVGYGGGGTNCSAPLQWLNDNNRKADVVLYISDYESWVDRGYGGGTGLMTEWTKFAKRNPNAKLVCMDLTPRSTSQVTEHERILQIGGFNDQVFNVVASFVTQGHDKNHWVAEIEKTALTAVTVEEENSDE